jgi:hypothetical protein
VHSWWWTGVRIGVFVLLVLFALAWMEAARKERAKRPRAEGWERPLRAGNRRAGRSASWP